MTTHIGHRTVVLGAGIAGLLAARVLSEAYSQVIVVDHDHLPANAVPRRCVPQGRHTHVLIERGQQVLEELFPGFTAELIGQGAPTLDNVRDVRWCLSGYRFPQPKSGMTVVSASRPFLEDRVRARVSELPGVTIVDRCESLGLVTAPNRHRVTGVRVVRHADGSAEEVLDADLIVDATGRGSRAPRWLTELGFEQPAEDKVHVGLGYATRIYRAPAAGLGSDLGVVIGPTPDAPRGGALQMLEGDRFLVTLMGMLGDYPPTDPDGFLDFARSLRLPDLCVAIRGADPIEQPRSFRFPASIRRRYERLARLPAGFLVTGDGFCSFNPIYAQGMTVAALEAITLRRHLNRGPEPDARAFFRDMSKVVDVPWRLSVGADLAFPEVVGDRNLGVRIANAYIPRLHAAAAHDPVLATAFLRVAALIDRPERLMSPGNMLRVLRQNLPHPGPTARHRAPDQASEVNAP
ncbi:NAD(P)/FAD-dependent oxidoreductase [Rhodococcus sp. WAY2]|uniref:NAD(P)/FAD-dependent oxidoreductase n=1 Tax=Rhodococcus sp. WAY2 TaxID=2663121 RepID=UPI00131FE8F6|nr:FAD-binding monooxygenase [Rhodococcus sp. WAY2]QHE72754.1 putative secreted protein [Rhodococcus sp. WAY2]